MLSKLNLENILFLDIETVPEVQNFSDLTPEKQALWAQKSQYQRKDEFSAEDYYPRAGIWAEFGKIICISVGYFASGEETGIWDMLKDDLLHSSHTNKCFRAQIMLYLCL